LVEVATRSVERKMRADQIRGAASSHGGGQEPCCIDPSNVLVGNNASPCALRRAPAITLAAGFQNTSVAEGMSIEDQLVGTLIYVSSAARRDDGSNVQRPSLQGAVTYTADGRFHFITTPTDAPKHASSDPARPSPDEAMAVASRSIAYAGTYTVDVSRLIPFRIAA
jgi:hypothetical protein